MNTFDNILEYVDIDDIPLKKWFCTTIVLQNAESHTNSDKDVDIFLMSQSYNGYLYQWKLKKE